MYEGHLPDGSSVQRHSAGPLYPYVIAARQHGSALEWGVTGPDTDGYIWVGAHADADRVATFYKSRYDRRQAAAQQAKTKKLTGRERLSIAAREIGDRILAHNQREWSRYAAQRG